MNPDAFIMWGCAVIVWGFAFAIIGVLAIAVYDFWRNF